MPDLNATGTRAAEWDKLAERIAGEANAEHVEPIRKVISDMFWEGQQYGFNLAISAVKGGYR